MIFGLWIERGELMSSHIQVAEYERATRRRRRVRRRPRWGPVRSDEEVGDYVLSDHAAQRSARRNLSEEDVRYVLRYGQVYHCANAVIYFLGRRDIPTEDLVNDDLARLEGTLVLTARHCPSLITVCRHRDGLKLIRKKFRRLRRRPI